MIKAIKMCSLINLPILKSWLFFINVLQTIYFNSKIKAFILKQPQPAPFLRGVEVVRFPCLSTDKSMFSFQGSWCH